MKNELENLTYSERQQVIEKFFADGIDTTLKGGEIMADNKGNRPYSLKNSSVQVIKGNPKKQGSHSPKTQKGGDLRAKGSK